MIIIWPKLITLNEVCFICIWKVEHATSFSFCFLLTQISSKVSMCQFSSPHQSGIHWTDDRLNQSNPKPFGPDWIFSPADWTGPFHTLTVCVTVSSRKRWIREVISESADYLVTPRSHKGLVHLRNHGRGFADSRDSSGSSRIGSRVSGIREFTSESAD